MFIRNMFLPPTEKIGDLLVCAVHVIRAEVNVVYEDVFGEEHMTSMTGELRGRISAGVAWHAIYYQAD